MGAAEAREERIDGAGDPKPICAPGSGLGRWDPCLRTSALRVKTGRDRSVHFSKTHRGVSETLCRILHCLRSNFRFYKVFRTLLGEFSRNDRPVSTCLDPQSRARGSTGVPPCAACCFSSRMRLLYPPPHLSPLAGCGEGSDLPWSCRIKHDRT